MLGWMTLEPWGGTSGRVLRDSITVFFKLCLHFCRVPWDGGGAPRRWPWVLSAHSCADLSNLSFKNLWYTLRFSRNIHLRKQKKKFHCQKWFDSTKNPLFTKKVSLEGRSGLLRPGSHFTDNRVQKSKSSAFQSRARGKKAGLRHPAPTQAHPCSGLPSPRPLHLAQRMLVSASISHARNFSPDVEAPGKINRKGIERYRENHFFL